MRKLFLGTDWHTDCDDVMALRVAAHFHKSGQIELTGVAINSCTEFAARSLDAFLRYEGLPHIEVGVDFNADDYGGEARYQKGLAQNFESKYARNDDCIDALKLYRKVLAQSKERVDIAEIGFLQVLAALLDSPCDEYSPLSGRELIDQKVGHLWIMGGEFDIDGGLEHNFSRTIKAQNAAYRVCRDWPGTITFLGFEVSKHILCGKDLPKSDPLGQVMRDYGCLKGRPSWDPMLTLLACIGDESTAGYNVKTGVVRVDPQSGKNFFKPEENGHHRVVVKTHDDGYYKAAVNRIIFS